METINVELLDSGDLFKVKNKFVVKNGWICKIDNGEVAPLFGDIHISNGRISDIKKKSFVEYLQKPKKKSKDDFDACGKVITIPQVNFHEHIYSRLAKGLDISGPTNNFENILSNLWWKLDSVLDKKMIEASAKMTVIESIKNGTTYLFDHHSSPNFTAGSLNTISNILNENNIRCVLCFETTDRNGYKFAQGGIKENLNFATITAQNQNIKSMFGLHASFTINNKTLKLVSEIIAKSNAGIHIHLSEDKADNKISLEKFGNSPLDRLIKYNLLNEKSILSHAVNLSKSDWAKIRKYKSAIAINSESNMNNSVGVNRFDSIPTEVRLLCGTDGMHANPSRTLKTVFLLMRQQGMSFDNSFAKIVKIYFDQIEFVKKYFPDFGLLNKNNRADFIIWDYVPPTPIDKNNFWGHYIYGIIERNVDSVFMNGKILMNEKQISIDEKKVNKEISVQGKRLFYKFKQMR